MSMPVQLDRQQVEKLKQENGKWFACPKQQIEIK